MKKCDVPGLEARPDMSLGTTLPVPVLEGSVARVTVGPFTVETLDAWINEG